MNNFIKKGLQQLTTKFVPFNLKYRPLGINYRKDGILYERIYPPYPSILTFPAELYNLCADYIVTPKFVDVPSRYVAVAENGRIYSTSTYVAVIDKSGSLIPEVSYHHVSINKYGSPADNLIFKTNYFIEPVNYKGTVFSLLSGGGAVTNYGHWLIDAIPRVGLLKKSGFFDEVDWFLVPNYKYDFHRDSLALLGIPSEKIIVAKVVNHIQADRIIASSSTRHIGHFPIWAGEFLRDSYLNVIKPEAYPPLTYIRRSDSGIRRILNEDELVDALKPYGFVDYELSKLPFSEKVNLFRSANIIISATGAGLSNIVFCKPGTKALELFHSIFISTMFADIASKVDIEYHYLIKDAGRKAKRIKEGEVGHYTVNVAEILNKVESMLIPKDPMEVSM